MSHLSENHFKEMRAKSQSSEINFCSSWKIFVHMHRSTARDNDYTPAMQNTFVKRLKSWWYVTLV